MFCFMMDYTNQMACKEIEISEVSYIKLKKIFRELCKFIMNKRFTVILYNNKFHKVHFL